MPPSAPPPQPACGTQPGHKPLEDVAPAAVEGQVRGHAGVTAPMLQAGCQREGGGPSAADPPGTSADPQKAQLPAVLGLHRTAESLTSRDPRGH